jgi:hypothetical protein
MEAPFILGNTHQALPSLVGNLPRKPLSVVSLAICPPIVTDTDAAISRFDCRLLDSLFRGFALDCCAGERSIFSLGR